MTASAENQEAIQVRRRFERLFGAKRLAEKIAAATGKSRTTAFRWCETGFPSGVVAYLDLLERTPRSEWPDQVRAVLEPAENS
jgi:hypothetical protein